jgi:uncharacterized membrane protein
MSGVWVLTPSLIMAFVIVVSLVLYYLLPRMTRPDVYFAVTVPTDFRDSVEGWSILKRFRVEVAIVSVFALLIALSPLRMGGSDYAQVLTLGGFFLQGAGVFVAYYRARRRVLPHAVAPATVREAALAPRQVRLPGGWLLQFPPFAILAGAGIWLHTHWEQIPESFPIHWGANGQPNNWSTRTPRGVYGPPLIGVMLCAVMGFLAYAFLRWSRPIQAAGPAGERERSFRKMVGSIVVATQYLLALEFTWIGLTPLAKPQAGPPGVVPFLVIALGFVVVVVVVVTRYGQGGTRLARAPVSILADAAPVGDRTPDKYWKLGLFYVNREDPALFIEKRFGVGYTLNFGHPGVWIGLAVLVAVTVAIMLLVPSNHRP